MKTDFKEIQKGKKTIIELSMENIWDLYAGKTLNGFVAEISLEDKE